LFLPDPEAERLARIAMRPLVAWNSERIVFAPFSPSGMNDRESVERLLPGVTDVFVAGAWLVFDGRPLEADEIRLAATSDAMDARKRTFFGVTHDGRPIAGAGENGADSARLAKAAAAIGARYAVLLDSGFSTSLAYQGEILAWGHRNADHGSRPIPHAILFHGTAATALPVGSATVVEAGGPSTWPGTLPGSAGPRPR
jgi:biofilm PGA synthesis lipoprotein PgaB